MVQQKYLFIDRDGTLIHEPDDKQVDHFEKFELLPNVVPALLELQQAGYSFVMVTNQNGIGRPSFPQQAFDGPQALLLQILDSQGITFEDVRVCPHMAQDNCECRKPKVGLVKDYMKRADIDREHSFVIGDRVSDLELANNMGVRGLRYTSAMQWPQIVATVLDSTRTVVESQDTSVLSILLHLEEAIQQCFEIRPQRSYTASLFNQGTQRIAQKVGEEGVEVALAALAADDEAFRGEAMDLLFHLLVLLRQREVSLEDVLQVARKRYEEGIDTTKIDQG